MLLLEDMLTKIKNAIDIKYEFGQNFDDGEEEDVTGPVMECLEKAGLEKYCDVACGASKVVIIPEYTNYVLKTPLFGSFSYGEYYDEEKQMYKINWNEEFSPFDGAWYEGADLDCSDYCALEEYIYGLAVDCGIADMFAKTELFGCTHHSRPVYISEKCKPYTCKKASNYSKRIVKSKRDSGTAGWYMMDSNAAATFIDDYGIEKASKLFDFIAKHHISDLHNENVMISVKTGKIVLSDYSGFHS